MSRPAPGEVAYWDDVASRRWGRYITDLETTAIEEAQRGAPEPRRALDVGCGTGRWTRLLLDRGWAVTGLDVDADALSLFDERSPEAERVLLPIDNAALPAPDGSVTLVICIEVLAVTHSDWFLREAHRVLAPGGRLVTIAWNRWSLRGLATDAASRLRGRGPHGFYRTSDRSWRRRLRETGFEVQAEKGLCWFPFGRGSDSPLVPASAAVERGLRLDRLPSLSPWVLVTAAKGQPQGTPALPWNG